MESIGLRELRQDASDLVRRVEAGEEITITVAGRPSARLMPIEPVRWCRWDELAELFNGASDPDWEPDQALVDAELRNPWDYSPRDQA